MNKIFYALSFVVVLLFSPLVLSAVYPLHSANDDLVGEVGTVITQEGENFNHIAHRYDVGYFELIEANPDVDPVDTPAGTEIIIPSQYVLPKAPRKGVVVNLAEMRLYYYPPGKAEVWTFPVGIGRQHTQTPMGNMKIFKHHKNPTWHAPQSIIAERAKQGVIIPKVVLPGPDNPLGDYALRLSRPSYLIHGTNRPSGVGRRSTAGCLSMFPEDIEKLFYALKDGDNILVIHQPYKIGRHRDSVYVEGHYPLAEIKDRFQRSTKGFKNYWATLWGKSVDEEVDVKKAMQVALAHQGIPERVDLESEDGE